MIEISESFLMKFMVHSQPNLTETKVREVVQTHWVRLLEIIDLKLDDNVNSNFLVGNHITLADFAIGQYILRFPLNEHQPANYRQLYQNQMAKYTLV